MIRTFNQLEKAIKKRFPVITKRDAGCAPYNIRQEDRDGKSFETIVGTVVVRCTHSVGNSLKKQPSARIYYLIANSKKQLTQIGKAELMTKFAHKLANVGFDDELEPPVKIKPTSLGEGKSVGSRLQQIKQASQTQQRINELEQRVEELEEFKKGVLEVLGVGHV